MPQGCGTWPAVWELGPDWPADGEIDIVEGVNDVVPNQSTLHTSPGCTSLAILFFLRLVLPFIVCTFDYLRTYMLPFI